MFVLIYSIIYGICQKNYQIALRYPAIAFLGSAATRRYPQLITMPPAQSTLPGHFGHTPNVWLVTPQMSNHGCVKCLTLMR